MTDEIECFEGIGNRITCDMQKHGGRGAMLRPFNTKIVRGIRREWKEGTDLYYLIICERRSKNGWL